MRQFNYIGPQVELLTGYPPARWTGFEFWAGAHPPGTTGRCGRLCQAGDPGKCLTTPSRHADRDRSSRDHLFATWSAPPWSWAGRSAAGGFIDITAAKRRGAGPPERAVHLGGLSMSSPSTATTKYTANKAYQVGRPLEGWSGAATRCPTGRAARATNWEECRPPGLRDGAARRCIRHPDAQGNLLSVETKAPPDPRPRGRVAGSKSRSRTSPSVTARGEERLKTQKPESKGRSPAASPTTPTRPGRLRLHLLAKMKCCRTRRSPWMTHAGGTGAAPHGEPDHAAADLEGVPVKRQALPALAAENACAVRSAARARTRTPLPSEGSGPSTRRRADRPGGAEHRAQRRQAMPLGGRRPSRPGTEVVDVEPPPGWPRGLLSDRDRDPAAAFRRAISRISDPYYRQRRMAGSS